MTDDQIKQSVINTVDQVYNMDTEAIRNLGAVSKSILTGKNYHNVSGTVTPGDLIIPANTTIDGYTNINGNTNIDGDTVINGTLVANNIHIYQIVTNTINNYYVNYDHEASISASDRRVQDDLYSTSEDYKFSNKNGLSS